MSRKRGARRSFGVLAGLVLLSAAAILPARGDDTPGSFLDAFEREMLLLAQRSEPFVVNVEARIAPTFRPGMTPPGSATGNPGGLPGTIPYKRRIGSGIALDQNGSILTTASLIEQAAAIYVQVGSGPTVPARVLGFDRRTNVALIQAEGYHTTPARLGESSLVTPGSRVVVVGSRPAGHPLSSFGCIELDRGLVWGYSEVEMLQLNAPVYRGHVGAPVVNSEGRVVAMVSGTLDPAGAGVRSEDSPGLAGYIYESRIIPRPGTDVTFAIPIEKAQEIAAELREKGRVERGFLGVRVRRGDAPAGAPRGVSIQEVLPGGPADRAGLVVGDAILDYAGQAVTVGDDVTFLVLATRPGSRVPLTISRGGREMTLDVAVGMAPNQYPSGAPIAPPEAAPPAPGQTVADTPGSGGH